MVPGGAILGLRTQTMRYPNSPDELLANLAWMRGLAARLVSSSGDAEDLAQEAALRALSSPAARGLSGPRLRAWLARAVRGLAIDRGRAAQRRKRREELVSRPEAYLDESADAGSLQLQELAGGLLALEEPYRTAILLHYGEGLDSAELAQRTGTSPAAVRQRLSRGRARLRQWLQATSQQQPGSRGTARDWFGCLPFFGPVRPWTLTMLKTWKLSGAAALALAVPLTVANIPKGAEGGELERVAEAPARKGLAVQAADLAESPPEAASAGPRASLAPAPDPVSKASIPGPDPAGQPPVPLFDALAPLDMPLHGAGADPASCVTCHAQGDGAEGGTEALELQADGWTQLRGEDGELLAEGELSLGRREGTWREFGEGEVLVSELSYRGGREHGEALSYDPLGKVIARGRWEQGRKSGTWQSWSSEGQLLELAVYEAGRKDGLASKWWPTGQMQEEAAWNLGLQHGGYRRWYPNGQLAEQGEFFRGHRVGAWGRWSADGEPE